MFKFSNWGITKPLFPIFLILLLLNSVIITDEISKKIFVPEQQYFHLIGILTLILSSLWLLFKTKTAIKLNFLDLLFILYFAYLLINNILFQEYYNSLIVENYLIILFLYISFRFFSFNCKTNYEHIFIIFLSFNILHCIYFFYNYILAYLNHYRLDVITGFFENTGTLTNYIIFSIPISYYYIFQCKESKNLKLLSIISLVFTVLIIFLVQSRTAILAFTIFSFLFFAKFINFKKPLHLKLFYVFLIITTVIFIVILYNLKITSAQGRLFIWKVCFCSRNDISFAGAGLNNFPYYYNNAQANYFKNYEFNENENYVAGEGTFAFNDFIQIYCEQGIVGVIFFLVLIIFVLYYSIKQFKEVKNFVFTNCLIIIVFCSFFSYPLQKISIIFPFYFFLAVLISYIKIKSFTISLTTIRLFLLLILCSSAFLINSHLEYLKMRYKWKVAFNKYESNSSQSLLEYTNLYSKFNKDKDFVYSYAYMLYVNKDFSTCQKVLENNLKFNNNTNFLLLLGDVYEKNNELEKSLKTFKFVSNIVPNLQYPHYRITLLYFKLNLLQIADVEAKKFLEMKVKVPSQSVNNMKDHISSILNKYHKNTSSQKYIY